MGMRIRATGCYLVGRAHTLARNASSRAMSPARTMASPGITYTCAQRPPDRLYDTSHDSAVYRFEAKALRIGSSTASGSSMRPSTTPQWRPARPEHSACCWHAPSKSHKGLGLDILPFLHTSRRRPSSAPSNCAAQPRKSAWLRARTPPNWCCATRARSESGSARRMRAPSLSLCLSACPHATHGASWAGSMHDKEQSLSLGHVTCYMCAHIKSISTRAFVKHARYPVAHPSHTLFQT